MECSRERSRIARRLGLLALALSLAMGPGLNQRGTTATAHADGLADEAELHFQIGNRLMRATPPQYEDALQHFLLSNRLVPNRVVITNIAVCYQALSQFANAHRYFIDALSQNPDAATADRIKQRIRQLAPDVAVLMIESTPPGATIYIDRRDLGSRGTAPRPLALDPGEYTVIAELEGYEPARIEHVQARRGAETPVHVSLRRVVGTVEVTGAAGVTVHIGSEHSDVQCVAPCSLEVPVGDRLLYFTREGYQMVSRPVRIEANQTLSTNADLSPLTGSLVVSAEETGARVEIDGRSVGFTPAIVPAVLAGKRKIKISLQGYVPYEGEIEIRPNQQSELNDVRLSPTREINAASRTTESIDDAPSSVTVLAPQELAAFGYPTIFESLRGVRGIYVSDDGAYPSAGVRGLGLPGDYGNRLLVLADGQPLNDNIINSSYLGHDARSDLTDVERIEIVRGPGSLLYGTGAFSGVVNLVMRGRDQPTGARVGLSTYSNYITRAHAGFNVKFGNDAGMWLSVSGARGDGRDVPVDSTDAMGNPIARTARNVDGFWSSTVQGRAWWRSLSMQFLLHTRDQTMPAGLYGTDFDNRQSHQQDSRGMLEIRFEPQLSRSVQLMTRVYGNLYNYRGDFYYTTDPTNAEVYNGAWFGGEARVVIKPIGDWRFTAGGEVQGNPLVEMIGGAQTFFLPPATRMGTPYINSNNGFTVGALYAVAEGSLTKWLRISAGFRMDINSLFVSQPQPNPRLAVIVKPWTGGLIKLMGGRAFRAPSVYEIFYQDNGLTTVSSKDGGGSLSPETIVSGELEFSQRFLNDWTALVTGHASYIENIIELVPLQGRPVAQYKNSPIPVLTGGVEAELRREWRQGWMVSANYSYQIANYLATPSLVPMPLDPSQNHLQVINAPNHLGSLKAVAPIVRGILSAALRVSLEGPRRISLESYNTTPPALVADMVLSGTIQPFNVKYSAGVYNLFDWKYASPLADFFSSYRTLPAAGRSLMVNITANF